MKCSLDISNFLEEFSSLAHSVAFLYFFALFILKRPSYLSLKFSGTLHSAGCIFPLSPSIPHLFVMSSRAPLCLLAFLFIRDGFGHSLLWRFWMVVLEKIWVPWTARKSNLSIPKEISPDYSLEGRMLKLKLQYFGHLMQRADSLEKTLIRGKIEGRRRREHQRIQWLDSITDSTDMNLSKLLERGVTKGWT